MRSDSKGLLLRGGLIILLSALITSSIINSDLLLHKAEAQNLQLRVSAAERPEFQNHFFGPQIVRVIIADPGATDPDESTVGLTIKGVSAPRAHLADGLWYHFLAEEDVFGIFIDLVTDGIRDGRIAVQAGGVSANPGDLVSVPIGGTVEIGTSTYTIVLDSSLGVSPSPIREIDNVGDTIFVEVDQRIVFPTLPNPFDETSGATNPDISLGTTLCNTSSFNTPGSACDWPYIRLIPTIELDEVEIRAGSVSVNLIYDDLAESISSGIDRSTPYPVNAEIIVSFTDFMWNINPVEEDIISFVLGKTVGIPESVLYRFGSSHQPAFSTDLLPILFRPDLNFDTRQLLELDAEGVNAIAFYEVFDSSAVGFPVVPANPGTTRVAQNSITIAEMDPNQFPALTMTETDPNTSVFESIDEQRGARSGIFAIANDRVANFDYFDIINTAAMTFHDSFATADQEIYDSADRAVFTVTDPDQNLRSKVSEQPPARESKAFVKVGRPFPLSNNPSLADIFSTSGPNRHTLKNASPPAGSTFDEDSIEVASFLLVEDIGSDVTSNPNIRAVVNFAGGDNPSTRTGIAAALSDFFLNANALAPTSPEDSQLIALSFNNPDIVPGGSFDKASGILINTAVLLQDLNAFQFFTLTKGQILRDSTAPSGSTPGAIQAFDIDPFVSAVSIYRTTGPSPQTIADLTSLAGNPTLETFFPLYNLIQVDLAGLNIGLEDMSGDRLESVSVQVEAFRDLNLNGKLDSRDELATSRRTMVDFAPFQDSDTDGNAIRSITSLGSTRLGVGSFRVVDLMNFDWDGDGATVFDGDTDDLRTTADGSILLRVSAVFVDNDVPAEPVKVLQRGSQIAVVDFSGIGSVVTQDTGTLEGIDQISLNAFQNMVYRIQVKEQGSNSSVFVGRMDLMSANQFDTTSRVLQDVVLQGDPAKAVLPSRFIPPDRLAFSYSDIDIAQSFRVVSGTFIYETRDGQISWDSESYKFGTRAIVTLEDEDLNRRPDAIERYDLPVAGFIFFELGKKRIDDTCASSVTGCFLAQVDATLMETGSNTGIFQGQIEMPAAIRLSDGTVVPTGQDDLEINYVDARDRSSISQEFDDIANIRTTLGQVLLDRDVYPQGPRLPPNQPLLGAIMYISIVDSTVNVDPDVRDEFDLTGTADFSSVTGNSNDIRDIVEIKIFNGGGIDPTIFSANPSSSLFAGGNAFPILDRNGNQVTKALETAPNTGIFEFESMIYCPDATPLQPFLREPICTDTIFNDLTTALGLPPIVTFKANTRIEVTYNDPEDDSGTPQDVNVSAVIQGVTAQLGTDKIEYDVGDPLTFFMIEPDFNFDSKAVEQVDYNFIGITTDKTPFDEVPLQFVLNALHLFQSFSSTEPGFRESDAGSGIFGAIAKPGVLDTLVLNRGTKLEIVYRDSTPSGGGSPIRLEHDIFLKANTPEIIFDREEYTPFDEVDITIISPDSNFDPFRIDTITPLISTSSDRGFRLVMPETGPDSRIFEQDIDLTPDKSRFPGDLIAQREDGLTIEFRIDSKTVVTKSVFINYHVGNVMFDRDAFGINDRVIMRVIDPDENRNPDTIDTIGVRLWSTTDRGGLQVILRETGDRSGIFEEFITFTADEESVGTRLRATEGDTITMKYSDRTLPAPAALDVDGVFTVEVEELFASALVFSADRQLERAVIAEPILTDETGAPMRDLSPGRQVLVQSQIESKRNDTEIFAYLVQIKDSDGVTVSLSWLSSELPPNSETIASQSWVPEAEGHYIIEVFLWESIDKPAALSGTVTTSVTVLKPLNNEAPTN